jgi:hypothetical protein
MEKWEDLEFFQKSYDYVLEKQDRKPYKKRKKIECVPSSRFSTRLKKIEHEVNNIIMTTKK